MTYRAHLPTLIKTMHPLHTLWHPPTPTHSHTNTYNLFSPSYLCINQLSIPSIYLSNLIPILPHSHNYIYIQSLPFNHHNYYPSIYPLSLPQTNILNITPIHPLANITIALILPLPTITPSSYLPTITPIYAESSASFQLPNNIPFMPLPNIMLIISFKKYHTNLYIHEI